MKKKIIVVVAVLLIAVFAFAQDRQERGKPNADMMLQHLTEELDLSEDQQENIKPLIEQQIKLMDEFHEKMQSGDRTERQQFQTENDKIADQIKAQLTEKQQTEYDEMREEMQKNRGNGPRRRS